MFKCCKNGYISIDIISEVILNCCDRGQLPSGTQRETSLPSSGPSARITRCMVNENGCKAQAKQISSFEANTVTSSDASFDTLCRSTVESANIRQYRNAILNEIYRMMSNIDMVASEADQLFGHERSWIFFDLLDTELCNCGSAGAISEFVPNMAESTNRHSVISFFEHASNTMNRLRTLLLECPDGIRLQQMPEQKFICLMTSVITSSLKTKTK
ncbi:hypothetical protein ACJMK2_029376 [Sinanodonta woodiana]|uniref:Uncharacterized protein n=1 Tax=Sinanodonta woodiana TaxID=1069815 RepID=A0ABD3XCB2_SINWO